MNTRARVGRPTYPPHSSQRRAQRRAFTCSQPATATAMLRTAHTLLRAPRPSPQVPFRLPPNAYSRLSFSPPLPARQYATPPTSSSSSTLLRRTRTAARYTFYLVGSTVVGVVILTGAVFLHDACTYTERVSISFAALRVRDTDPELFVILSQHVDRVPVAPRALSPERGGPKNLPVLSTLLSDWEDEESRELTEKPHLVIVGGGWGVRLSFCHTSSFSPIRQCAQAVGVLEKLSPGDYHVTIISPETYTTFTPLLPCTFSSPLR